jgi:hypothetical protein
VSFCKRNFQESELATEKNANSEFDPKVVLLFTAICVLRFVSAKSDHVIELILLKQFSGSSTTFEFSAVSNKKGKKDNANLFKYLRQTLALPVFRSKTV